MECSYCYNTFKTKSSLNNHIRNAKYCLEKRSKKPIVYYCEFCDKKFSSKYGSEKHKVKCMHIHSILKEKIEKDVEKRYIDQIAGLKSQISKLQDKLENIALQAVKRPTTTTNKTQINNFIQNMQPITADQLIEYTPQLTIEHVQKGASGYAEYALEYPLKDRVVCVDYARRKIKFKNRDGNLVTDPEMAKLAPMFFESIKAKSNELIYSQNTPDMDSAMFEEVAKLFNTNADVKNASSGIKTEFYHDFVKHVCSGSVVE